MTPTLVTLDLDGTLWEHRELSRRALEAAWDLALREFPSMDRARLDQLHAEMADDACGSLARFERLLARAGVTREGLAVAMDNAFNEKRLDLLRADPGAPSVLQELRARGLTLGVITNGRAPVQRAKLARAGLEACFDFVLAGLGPEAKPAPDLFRAASRLAGSPADRCLHVGDSWEQDVMGAVGAGWRAVHLSSSGSRPRSHRRVRTIKRLEDLTRVLPLDTREE